MKESFAKILTVLAVLMLAASCSSYTEDSPGVDGTRISLSPPPQEFQQNGRTAEGTSEYVAVVTVLRGSSVIDMGWKAEIVGSPSWVDFVSGVNVEREFYDHFSGKTHITSERGVNISCRSNSSYSRYFVLRVTADDGTVADFDFRQAGEFDDARVQVETLELDLLADDNDPVVVPYTTNMGSLYSVSTDQPWLHADIDAAAVTITADDNPSEDEARVGHVTISVGSEETSSDSAVITVTQLQKTLQCFVYGAPLKGHATPAEGLRMNALENNVRYSASAYFRTEDAFSLVVTNKNKANHWPRYALADGGSLTVLNSGDDAVPVCHSTDLDGMKLLAVNIQELTWTMARITTKNCMPDAEIANYTVKSYEAEGEGVKTWITQAIHWDGGPSMGTYKLGSGLVAGSQTGGYGSKDWTVRLPEYDTEENGGTIPELMMGDGVTTRASVYGRLYSANEIFTGDPDGALNPSYSDLHPYGQAGEQLVDAVGRSFTLEVVTKEKLQQYARTSAGNAKAEEEVPQITMQLQGICPYGWHIANMQDWKDLFYAQIQFASTRSVSIDAGQASYSAMADGASENCDAYLRSPLWATEDFRRKEGNFATVYPDAEDFGICIYPNGWRLLSTGYDRCANSGTPYHFEIIPMLGKSSSHTWRIYCDWAPKMMINDAHMMGNVSGQCVRCVKNYEQ